MNFMAIDPRLAPGGLAELRNTVAALHQAEGIGTILDLVFNHTGESDRLGPTPVLRGFDNQAYYRHTSDGRLVNDTGTGNTVACDHPVVREMVLDTLRHFVRHAGVDGFRFDLAPVLGARSTTARSTRKRCSFRGDRTRTLLLADRVLIAEPWDIGPNGYQLGNFQRPLFSNGTTATATTMSGASGAAMPVWSARSSHPACRLVRCLRQDAGNSSVSRSVNFLAAHDGMTRADIVAYERKHNAANGEQNRDGHNDNLSWNNGVVLRARRMIRRSLPAALRRPERAARHAVCLARHHHAHRRRTNSGRSQQGNNKRLRAGQCHHLARPGPAATRCWRITRRHHRRCGVLLAGAGRYAFPDRSGGRGSSHPRCRLAHRDRRATWRGPTGTTLPGIASSCCSATWKAIALSSWSMATAANASFTLPAREGFAWRPAIEVQAVDLARLPGRSVNFAIERRATNTRARKGS